MIIAVDFDGTLCTHKYPEIGSENIVILVMLKSLKDAGHKIILWTCRDGEYLKKAVEWCAAKGLKFDAVNEDIPEVKNSDFGRAKSQKIYADIYLDDRNLSIQHIGLLFGHTQ